jgi:hypothetical protein
MERKEIQNGLYWELVTEVISPTLTIKYSKLYAAEGYHFHDINEEYYDEEGNPIPIEEVEPSKRNYSTYCSTPETTEEELNARFISCRCE